MYRFRNILCVVATRDGEETLRRAALRARLNGATLTLATVLPPPLLGALRADPARGRFDALVRAQQARLDQMARPLRAQGLSVATTVLCHERPFVAIIRQILRYEHDLLIIEAEKERGATQRLLGDTTLHLLRKCPCPVWVIKATPGERYRRILAAVDVALEEESSRALNRQLVEMARSLAAHEGAELHLLHAWELYGESILRSPRVALSEEELWEMMWATRRERELKMKALVRSSTPPMPSPAIHLEKGKARQIIPALARELRADLVVMGTVGRAGIPGLLIGNTVETILRELECSVLAVKPAGWKSPVTLEAKRPAEPADEPRRQPVYD